MSYEVRTIFNLIVKNNLIYLVVFSITICSTTIPIILRICRYLNIYQNINVENKYNQPYLRVYLFTNLFL